MCEAASETTSPSLYGSLLHRPPASARQPTSHMLEPHATAFSLAANLLEAAVCIALLRGQRLSAMWALAKAGVFWILHLGHLSKNGYCLQEAKVHGKS
eukprot:6208972-Pleurochrysis_carterae.AAC.3